MRIISGGQTGADRAALDVALELGFEVGGWVPLGRAAEDGPIPDHYPNLREAETAEPGVRTKLNVEGSDATVVLSHGTLSGGSALTVRLAEQLERPLIHLDLDRLTEQEASVDLDRWLARLRPAILNIAGPRASEDPRIYAAAKRVLRMCLGKPTRASPESRPND